MVLTHNHSDHTALLPQLREAFHPKVFAFSPNIAGVDGLLRDGDSIKMGDEDFEVIHTPGHSSDSICLYNRADGVLFVGDSPLLNLSPEAIMRRDFWRHWRRYAPAMFGQSISGTALRWRSAATRGCVNR